MTIMIPVVPSESMPAKMPSLPGLLLITGLVFCSGAHAAPSDTQADVGCMFDDNVTRANEGGAKLNDYSCSVNLSQPIIFPLVEHARILLAGSLGGEIFERYKGLSRLTEAVHGEIQYRSTAKFGTPVFALFARIIAEQYQSDLRDGIRYSAGISMRQTVTDRIQLFGAMAHNMRDGKRKVFDNRDNSARLNLDYSQGTADTIYLGWEYRIGDLVTSGVGLGNTYNSQAYALDDAFPGKQIYCFRLNGTTALTTIGYNRKLGARDSIDFSWKQVRSSVSYEASYWSGATLSYLTNLYSVAYLVRF